MHVCFSRGAIDAGTESVSHKPRSTSEKPSIFFKTAVTAALNKQRRKSSELKSQRLSRRSATGGAKQALALATRKRGHAYSNALRDHSLGAISALSPNRGLPCAGTGRNVLSCALVRIQRRREVRTWTSTRSDDFGFHQDPQQDEWSVWASQEDEAEGLL